MKTHEITDLLHDYKGGDKQALDRLLPLVDPELKKAARRYMRIEPPGETLQPTALVNEALIRLIKENLTPEDRGQFYGFVKKRMRQVLVDYARQRGTLRRGNRSPRVELSEIKDRSSEKPKELVLLDEALTELAKKHERKVAVIEYRFFVGLSIEETAEVMGLAPRTVQRDWEYAQAWLNRYMTTSDHSEL
jgi:RNA polymerase sigma factor (TIGR02999 family)